MTKATRLTNILRRNQLDLVVYWEGSYFHTNGHKLGRSFDEAISYIEGEFRDYPKYEYHHGIKILRKKFPESISSIRLKQIR